VNPVLFWTSIVGGAVVLAVVGVSVLVGRHATVVPRRALDVAVASVGVFLVCIGVALLAGETTSILVVWLVALLVVVLVCVVLRLRTDRQDRSSASSPSRDAAVRSVEGVLRRADYQQLSLVLLVVAVDDADLITRALGRDALVRVRDTLSTALGRALPADATVWSEADDRVGALVRADELDRGALRAEVDEALVDGVSAAGTVLPRLVWHVAETDARGYGLSALLPDSTS